MLHLLHNSVMKYRFAYAWTKVKTGTHYKVKLVNQTLDSPILSNRMIECNNSLVNRLLKRTRLCTRNLLMPEESFSLL